MKPAANKKHTENLDFCMTFVLRIYAIYITNTTVQHEGCILPISTTFELLTSHSSRLSSVCKQKRNVAINDLDFLTKHISL